MPLRVLLLANSDGGIKLACVMKHIPIRLVPIEGEALRRELRVVLEEPGVWAARA